MEFVTVSNGGITQSVPKADLALYIRAGYSVVGESSAPIESVAQTEPVPVDSKPAPVPEKSRSSKTDK